MIFIHSLLPLAFLPLCAKATLPGGLIDRWICESIEPKAFLLGIYLEHTISMCM